MNLLILLLSLGGLPPEQLLISTEKVGQLEKVLLVDVRPAADFEAGHIPGAASLDQALLSEERDGIPNLLKPADALRAVLAQAGISDDRHIVVYTGMAQPDDIKSATRVFWALEYLSYPKVSLLDGGLAKWKAEERPIETGPSKVAAIKPGSLKLKVREELLVEYETVLEMVKTGEGALVDCRSPEEYAGITKKPFIAQLGNISGAINLPSGDLLQDDAITLKRGDALRGAVAASGLKSKSPVVTYCNSGRDATVGYFGLRLNGIEHIAVYDASMAEWAAQKALPLSTAP